MLAGGIRMYRHEDYEQLKLELPFGVTLREDNRWVLLSKLFPWEDSHSVGTIYKTRFEKTGDKNAETPDFSGVSGECIYFGHS